MPITYSILERESLVLVRAFGSVTTRELFDLISAISSDKAIQAISSVLIDCTEVKSVMLVTGLREVAFEIGKLAKGKSARIAIAAPEGFVFGLGRAFATYGEFFGVRANVFRSIEEACSWLNVLCVHQYQMVVFEAHEEYYLTH